MPAYSNADTCTLPPCCTLQGKPLNIKVHPKLGDDVLDPASESRRKGSMAVLPHEQADMEEYEEDFKKLTLQVDNADAVCCTTFALSCFCFCYAQKSKSCALLMHGCQHIERRKGCVECASARNNRGASGASCHSRLSLCAPAHKLQCLLFTRTVELMWCLLLPFLEVVAACYR